MENEEDSAMESEASTTVEDTPHLPAPSAPTTDRAIEVDGSRLHIRDLSTERPSIVAYLRTISPGKQEIALLHALEVGITELAARRERFKH
jgi:hypothetical protein